MKAFAPLLLALPLLAGCELFGESAASIAARREAEGKAIGAACRHAARAIEECFALNRKAEKAAVYSGWREMNDYMRENRMEAAPATEVAAGDAAEAAEPLPERKPSPAKKAKPAS